MRSIRNSLLECYSAAHDFLHAPVDVRTVAAIRIGYASLLLINVLCWWPDLDLWFSETGVLPLEASRRVIDPKCLTLFQVLPTDPTTLHVVYGVFIAQLIGLLFGWLPRLQAACCFVWLVSFQHRNSLLFEGEDTLFRIMGFLLIFMPLGHAWSVHSAWSFFLPSPRHGRGTGGEVLHRRGEPFPQMVDGWPVRLLQLEMTMLYFSSAWSKLLGQPWRDGTALYYVMRLDEYWGRFPLPSFVEETPWIVRGLTWSTMALEFAIPVLIWFAPTRRFALFLVLLFHLSCDYTMHLFLFHWIMLVGWLAFLQPDDITRLRHLHQPKLPSRSA